MSDRGILDTSVLIGTVTPLPGRLTISVVSIAELQFGVLVARNEDVRATRLSRLQTLVRRFDPLPVDEAVADSYAVLAAALVRGGRSPRPRAFDLLVAATAHAHEARLFTRNPDDCRGLESMVEVVGVPPG